MLKYKRLKCGLYIFLEKDFGIWDTIKELTINESEIAYFVGRYSRASLNKRIVFLKNHLRQEKFIINELSSLSGFRHRIIYDEMKLIYNANAKYLKWLKSIKRRKLYNTFLWEIKN